MFLKCDLTQDEYATLMLVRVVVHKLLVDVIHHLTINHIHVYHFCWGFLSARGH